MSLKLYKEMRYTTFMKSLKIDCYIDGYNASHLNCSDVPVAGATGYYNYDDYYFYCFYYCYFHNWGNVNTDSYIDFRNEILKKVGLAMMLQPIKDDYELISLIKQNIDNSHPVVMLPNYNALFYSNDYLSKNKASHGIVISDYDKDRSIVIIRDDIHIRSISGNPTTIQRKGQALLKMQITEDMLKNIWKMSDNSNIYSIISIGEAKVKKYIDLVSDVLDNYSFKQSKLLEFIEHYSLFEEKMKNQGFAEQVMKNFCNSVIVLFDVFEKTFEEANHSNSYKIFKEKYLNFRQLLIAKLHANAYRGIYLSKKEKNKILENIQEMDNKLLCLINDLYNNYIRHKESTVYANKQINYALSAKASASSEYFAPAFNNVYAASHAVNGKWENIRTDTWISSSSNIINWLKVDLGQPRTINKFVIRHFARQGYNTIDFKIQALNNAKKWVDLVNVKNNSSDITIHDISSSTYRYFRIYITKPGECDFHTRINEFEIWGNV